MTGDRGKDGATVAGGLSRRALAGGLLAGAAAGCTTVARPPLVSINLADEQPPPAGQVTRLETAFDQGLRMTVPVHVGRRGPFAFVVDTGANRTVVSRELAAACELASAGVAAVHGIAGEEPASMVKVPRLRVGQVSSANLVLPALFKERLGADGLLGVDVLRGRRIRLNFRANTFEIGPSLPGASFGTANDTRIRRRDQPVSVPARYRFGQLVIFDAEVAGVPVSAFLDSGSQITVGNLALRRAIAAARPDLSQRMTPTPLISATGQTAMADMAALPVLRLGGVGIYDLRAAFADLHIFNLWNLTESPAVLVGVDVLRYFDDVVLDFGQRRVIFTPPPHPLRRPVRAPGQGVRP